VPWLYIRAKLAEQWHVPPWVVDMAPEAEIRLAQQLDVIEAEERRT
jgi:hypothetical protein